MKQKDEYQRLIGSVVEVRETKKRGRVTATNKEFDQVNVLIDGKNKTFGIAEIKIVSVY